MGEKEKKPEEDKRLTKLLIAFTVLEIIEKLIDIFNKFLE